jgi:hypothetical protein
MSVSDQEIWTAANLIIKRLGAEARREAVERAGDMLVQGDAAGLGIAHRMDAAIRKHFMRWRPPIFEEAFCPRARKLALLGFTEVEIAEQFGISPDTIQEWKAEHREFSVALEGGKAEADAEVAASS